MKRALQKEIILKTIGDVEAVMHTLRSLPASADPDIEKRVQALIEQGQQIIGDAERALAQGTTSASLFLTECIPLKNNMRRLYENDEEALKRENGEYIPNPKTTATSSYRRSYAHRSRRVDAFMGRDGR